MRQLSKANPVKKDDNIYLPHPARILKVTKENAQITTLSVAFTDLNLNDAFRYQPGQFMMVSAPHCGEAPISISSTPTRPGAIELSVRKAGTLTGALHDLKKGALIGLRGPYGRPFPMETLRDRDLLFVAGGIGLAPLRSVINFCLDNKGGYGTITILYGSRSPQDIAFRADLKRWQQEPGVECLLSVDTGGADWQGQVGVVTTLFTKIKPDTGTTSALICGPPIMIRFVLAELSKMGFADQDIITTLERHMKCGVGVCRHCHMDRTLVCTDGPVFTLAQLRALGIKEF